MNEHEQLLEILRAHLDRRFEHPAHFLGELPEVGLPGAVRLARHRVVDAQTQQVRLERHRLVVGYLSLLLLGSKAVIPLGHPPDFPLIKSARGQVL